MRGIGHVTACASNIFCTYSPNSLHLQEKLLAPAELKSCVNHFYFWSGKVQSPNSKFLHSIELPFCRLACFCKWIFVHVQYRNTLDFSIQSSFITCQFKRMPPTKQVIAFNRTRPKTQGKRIIKIGLTIAINTFCQ